MARAKKSVRTTRRAPQKRAQANGTDEASLTKGQLRKLNALRKSLGEEIANKAFAQWFRRGATAPAAEVDKNAAMIAESLGGLANDGKLRIPRGGYLVTRGRGRVIVERAQPD